jgi:hypothetical protein
MTDDFSWFLGIIWGWGSLKELYLDIFVATLAAFWIQLGFWSFLGHGLLFSACRNIVGSSFDHTIN